MIFSDSNARASIPEMLVSLMGIQRPMQVEEEKSKRSQRWVKLPLAIADVNDAELKSKEVAANDLLFEVKEKSFRPRVMFCFTSKPETMTLSTLEAVSVNSMLCFPSKKAFS